MVLIDEIIFRGRKNIDWKEVETYLRKFVGELVEVASTKEVIKIKSNFPDEYTGSVYTNQLKGTRAKAKANLSQGILGVIQIAKKIFIKSNKKEKHKKGAYHGWHYYKTRFAIPIFHEKTKEITYSKYSAVLLVQHSIDGNLYLYDIQNIKKETSNPP